MHEPGSRFLCPGGVDKKDGLFCTRVGKQTPLSLSHCDPNKSAASLRPIPRQHERARVQMRMAINTGVAMARCGNLIVINDNTAHPAKLLRLC